METLKTILIFLLAGICEIGGGYLVWLWLKAEKPLWYGLSGAFFLFTYGIIGTWQTASFARVYASYGGIFVLLSLLWSYQVDHFKPDKYDLIGSAIIVVGAGIIYFMPRN